MSRVRKSKEQWIRDVEGKDEVVGDQCSERVWSRCRGELTEGDYWERVETE